MANIQLVVFELAGNEYGIDALAVNGILRAKKFKIRQVPGLPTFVEGAIQLRGNVNYIFNLRTKFGVEDCSIGSESKFIMLNVGSSIAGCIVDEVTDIIKFDMSEIEPLPTFTKNEDTAYIQGIGKVDDRIIILLDSQKLLSTDECIHMEEALPHLEKLQA